MATTKKILTLEELEAKLNSTTIKNNNNSQTNPSESSTATTAVTNNSNATALIEKLLSLEEKKRSLLLEIEKKKHNPVMSLEEQLSILNKQYLQLTNDTSFSIDYYYRHFNKKTNASSSNPNPSTSTTVTNSSSSDILGLVNRNINQKSKKQTLNKLEIAGALGKISISAPTIPKQRLNVSHLNKHSSTLNRKSILLKIESILLHLVELDDLTLSFNNNSNKSSDSNSIDMNQWNKTYTLHIKSIWSLFNSLDGAENSNVLLSTPIPPKSAALFLSFKKTRALIPRLLKYLPSNQQLSLLESIIQSMKFMIINSTSPKDILQEIDEYLSVVYSFIQLFNSISLNEMNLLFNRLLSSQEDLYSILKTKPGLLFISCIISRAEILKSSETTTTPESSEEYNQLFKSLFGVLQGKFVTLFPPLYVLDGLFDNGELFSVDDSYVWQFFSCFIVGCDLSEQRIVVSELRDRIYENVKKGGKDRVNMFLNVLGLDVDMLS